MGKPTEANAIELIRNAAKQIEEFEVDCPDAVRNTTRFVSAFCRDRTHDHRTILNLKSQIDLASERRPYDPDTQKMLWACRNLLRAVECARRFVSRLKENEPSSSFQQVVQNCDAVNSLLLADVHP
jgi:hypothetical protein